MSIVGKLVFRGITTFILGGGIVLSAVGGVHIDPEIKQLLNSQGIIELFKAQPPNRHTQTRSESPLLREAKAFAMYLNPPQPLKKEPEPQKKTTQTSEPVRPPEPTVKFKVLATTCYHARPAESMALIWQPGGDLQWVKPGTRLGHFLVEQIKHGVLVYKDGDDLREVAVLSESEQKKGPDTGHEQLAANIHHKLIDTHE